MRAGKFSPTPVCKSPTTVIDETFPTLIVACTYYLPYSSCVVDYRNRVKPFFPQFTSLLTPFDKQRVLLRYIPIFS